MSVATYSKDFLVGSVRGSAMGIARGGRWGLKIGFWGGAIMALASMSIVPLVGGVLIGASSGVLIGGFIGGLFGGVSNANEGVKHARAEKVLAERARVAHEEAMHPDLVPVHALKEKQPVRDGMETEDDRELNALTKKLSDTQWRDRVVASRQQQMVERTV